MIEEVHHLDGREALKDERAGCPATEMLTATAMPVQKPQVRHALLATCAISNREFCHHVRAILCTLRDSFGTEQGLARHIGQLASGTSDADPPRHELLTR